MASGIARVQRSHGLSLARVFMDDRSFTSSTVEGLLSQVNAWESFSVAVGLRESAEKIQLTSSSTQGLDQLVAAYHTPGRVSFDFVVLGCSSAVRFRGLSSEEADRIARAKRTTFLVGLLRLGFEHRSFAVNKFVYGWVWLG